MADSSDYDRDDDLGLSDDPVPSEDENSVTCVPATDEDSSVVVLSEDNKRPLKQSSSLRSSNTRAQELFNTEGIDSSTLGIDSWAS